MGEHRVSRLNSWPKNQTYHIYLHLTTEFNRMTMADYNLSSYRASISVYLCVDCCIDDTVPYPQIPFLCSPIF